MLIGQKATVVGAGIGGLAAALALALRGAQVTVLEQAEAIREVGAGLQITPNGAAVLAGLGLGDGLRRIGLPGQAIALRDGVGGRAVARLPLDLAPGPYNFVHRADLQGLLADAARAAGVAIRLLHRVERFDIDSGRAVLTTAAGAQVRSPLVVAADGLHSVLRRAVGPAPAPAFTGQVAWRALVQGQGPAEPGQATVFMGPGRHIVRYPLRGGSLINLVAVEERAEWLAEGWSHRGDPAALRAAFAGFCPEVQALLRQVDQVHLWGLFRHPVAPLWHRGPVALLGDAAHPTLPFLAQGANMALEDAWVLADCLSNFDGIDAALTAYQAARRDRCERVVAAAAQNARNFHLSNPVLRRGAHLGLSLAGRLAPGALTRRYDWIYGYDAARPDG